MAAIRPSIRPFCSVPRRPMQKPFDANSAFGDDLTHGNLSRSQIAISSKVRRLISRPFAVKQKRASEIIRHGPQGFVHGIFVGDLTKSAKSIFKENPEDVARIYETAIELEISGKRNSRKSRDSAENKNHPKNKLSLAESIFGTNDVLGNLQPEIHKPSLPDQISDELKHSDETTGLYSKIQNNPPTKSKTFKFSPVTLGPQLFGQNVPSSGRQPVLGFHTPSLSSSCDSSEHSFDNSDHLPTFPVPSTTSDPLEKIPVSSVARNLIATLKQKSKDNSGFNDRMEKLSALMDAEPSHEELKERETQNFLECDWTVEELIKDDRASPENFNLLIRAFGAKSQNNYPYNHAALSMDADPSPTIDAEFQGDRWLYEAFQVAEKMDSLGYPVDEEIFVSLIRACKHRPDLARRAFLEMRSRLITPTVGVYSALMKSHAKDLPAVFSLARKMEDEKFTYTTEIATIMIDALVGAGRNDLAWEEFWRMRTWKNIKPNEVMFTVMMKTCIKKAEAEKALGILQDLKDCNLRPTELTYITLITVLAKRKDFAKKAIEIWRIMEAEGMKMSKRVAENLLQAAATLGDLKLLTTVIQEIDQHNSEENNSMILWSSQFCALAVQTTATAMRLPNVSDFERLTNLRVAWQFVSDAKAKGIPMTAELLNEIMNVYRCGGYGQHCIDMLSEFARLQIAPNNGTYICLLKLFGEDLKDSARFFAVLDDHPELLDQPVADQSLAEVSMTGSAYFSESSYSLDAATPAGTQVVTESRREPSDETRWILSVSLDLAFNSKSASRTIWVLKKMAEHRVFPSPNQTEKLARVGRKIPEVHACVSGLIATDREMKLKESERVKNLTALDIKEHEARLALEGATTKTATVQQEVRAKFFEKKKKLNGGHDRPWLPKSQYHQLTKKGGDLYSKKVDKPSPNVLL